MLDGFTSSEESKWRGKAKDHALKYVQTDDIHEKQESYGCLMVSVSIKEIVGSLKNKIKYLSDYDIKGCKYKLEKLMINERGVGNEKKS
jgi:hypothetical protein